MKVLKSVLIGTIVAGSCLLAPSCKKSDVAVTGIQLDKNSLSMKAGETQTLKATVSPADATDKAVTWSSNNESVATVSGGKVTVPAGAEVGKQAIITAEAGGHEAYCTVTVTDDATIAVEKVELNKATIELEVDGEEMLVATVLPENATDRGVVWKSSAESIATVSDNGVVKGISKGSTTITVTTRSGSKTATCAVNVVDKSTPPTPLEVVISGSINHDTYTPGESGTVAFNRFPATVEEFKQVRSQIGEEPHGAVALQLMAYEMYRRNRTIGKQCIELNNTLNNVSQPIARLNELFGNDANYARPYQIAAFLKGATPENGYNPPKPYTVEVKVNNGVEYQYSNDYQTTILFLEVLTQGKDKGSETLYVLKTMKPGEPGEGKYFIINNCPGLYAQVKAVSFDTPFEGLD